MTTNQVMIANEKFSNIENNVHEFKFLTIDELKKTLGLTIKRDDENKLITFLCALSAYTENAQFNLSFNAPSSSGKSFIPTEIAKLFPKEDVIATGYCSPTAFFHDQGIYDKTSNSKTINFKNKILIFLDQPHNQLLERLRPILSHDEKQIKIKITDKSEKGGLRTKNVVINGYPAVIFCSAGQYIDEQESTRFILLSPEINQHKLRDAITEKIIKDSNAQAYDDWINKSPERLELKTRIVAIKNIGIKDIKIANPDKIENLFFSSRRLLKPRHQRDIGRLISIAKVLALINCWYRENDNGILIANDNDVEEAMVIWNKISESQEFNLSPYIYDIYKNIILSAFQEKRRPISRLEVASKYLQVNGNHLDEIKLRQQIMPMLVGAGLVVEEPDKNDKRKILITPIIPSHK